VGGNGYLRLWRLAQLPRQDPASATIAGKPSFQLNDGNLVGSEVEVRLAGRRFEVRVTWNRFARMMPAPLGQPGHRPGLTCRGAR
ncbi:hypothetical protein, partial [Mesorhizobium sp. M1E.F.Ca.ET.063.01.1.1]|uniref:hypothetical protein n=1 Tax=Mesorhizobium sp. M1E.F.Ca.ET.063.01.1.1 TaxID=2496750 RepID=UPI001AECE907